MGIIWSAKQPFNRPIPWSTCSPFFLRPSAFILFAALCASVLLLLLLLLLVIVIVIVIAAKTDSTTDFADDTDRGILSLKIRIRISPIGAILSSVLQPRLKLLKFRHLRYERVVRVLIPPTVPAKKIHPPPLRAFTLPGLRGGSGAFTLVEMLVVIAIVLVLTLLLAPAFTSLKSAGDVTSAAYTIKGVLEQARTYAMANNTYTWVGFYEEDGSTPSASPTATLGTGRLVISIVASKDGTTAYNPNSLLNPDPIDPTRLIQIGKLVKIDNVHLPILSDGTGTGDTFDTRPPPGVSYDTACSCYNTRSSRFGDINVVVPQSAPSTNSKFPFHYPLSAAFPGQYRFSKIFQFNPSGESSINSTYGVLRVVEFGLVSTHGSSAPRPSPGPGLYPGNVVAIQITGFAGNVTIYRR